MTRASQIINGRRAFVTDVEEPASTCLALQMPRNRRSVKSQRSGHRARRPERKSYATCRSNLPEATEGVIKDYGETGSAPETSRRTTVPVQIVRDTISRTCKPLRRALNRVSYLLGIWTRPGSTLTSLRQGASSASGIEADDTAVAKSKAKGIEQMTNVII